jgi:hypothetical protein
VHVELATPSLELGMPARRQDACRAERNH